MNAGTCWEQEYNRPNGLSVEKAPKSDLYLYLFISQVTWTDRTIVTGQTTTLKKFMNALYTAARWRYGVQFRHTGSSDLTFSKMKSGSQWLAIRICMLRCCNLLLHLHWTIFHNFTKPGFNMMVRHRTLQGNQWQLCENCSVTVSSQDSVTFRGPQLTGFVRLWFFLVVLP